MSLQELFETVVNKVNSSPALPMAEIHKLKLYGYYKRITVGTTAESGEDEPSIFNIVGKKKRRAWVECDDMTKDECMLGYVKIIASIEDAELGKDAAKLLEEFEAKQ